jgi:hypothetical protein
MFSNSNSLNDGQAGRRQSADAADSVSDSVPPLRWRAATVAAAAFAGTALAGDAPAPSEKTPSFFATTFIAIRDKTQGRGFARKYAPATG